MSRKLIVIGAAMAMAGFSVAGPAAVVADETRHLGTSGCADDSWIGGITEWCDGVLVHRDYVYDDTGADTALGSPHGTSLSRATGDVDHREHGQALNSADILTVTVRRDGDALAFDVLLNTLFPSDGTVVAVALDLDPYADTGGGPWGVVDVASAGHDQVTLLDQRDPQTNTITGSVPLPAGLDDEFLFTMQAVAALGDGTPMNAAFRGDERGNWWEARQSAAFAAGDISTFGTIVRLGDFGRQHKPARLHPGYHERIYRSDVTVPRSPDEPAGEGVAYGTGVVGRGAADSFGQFFTYLGHHQPYGIYVPEPGEEPYGLQLALHGYNAAHASLVGSPGMQRRFGDDLGRIVVVPLGRGPAGFYSDHSERDVLDVMDDVITTYGVDEDQVFSGGYSMGGYGAYRMSVAYPDRFAGAVNWVGATGDCLQGGPTAQGRARPEEAPLPMAVPDLGTTFSNDPSDRGGCPTGSVGNVFDYLDNLRYVPTGMIYAAADELVWANHAVALQQRWAELGYEHALWVHAGEHLTFALADDWAKEAAYTSGRVRPDTVRHVTFRTNPWLWSPDLGIVHDGTWWVHDMVPRDRGKTENWAPGTLDLAVDLISHACPDDSYTVAISNGAGIDPVPWVSQVATPVPSTTDPGSARITGTLTNVAEVTIDLADACLAGQGDAVAVDVTSDGPATVHVVDGTTPVRTVTVG